MKHLLFDHKTVESKIKYTFSNKEWLSRAFIHSSFANDNNLESNERMEFFGDAILEFLVTKYLYNKYPEKSDGELSKARASIISATGLKKAVVTLDLMTHLVASPGAKVLIKNSHKIEANLYESLLCAIYFDGGIERAEEFVIRTLKDDMDSVDSLVKKDYLSYVNEYCQKNKIKVNYKFISKTGSDDKPTFLYELYFNEVKVAQETGSSKQKAKENVAKLAVEQLELKKTK